MRGRRLLISSVAAGIRVITPASALWPKYVYLDVALHG